VDKTENTANIFVSGYIFNICNACAGTYIYIYICMYIRVCTLVVCNIYIYILACMRACAHVYKYIYACTYICIVT
jgi:small basic protein